MQDDENGREQQGGWEPPGYVSPWMPASGSGDEASGANDTISFGSGPEPGADPGGEPGHVPPPGYMPPGYAPPPGYGGPGYGGPGYAPPPGYVPPGFAPPWGGYGAPPPPPPQHSGVGRVLAYLAVAVLAAGAGAGAAIALNHTTNVAASASPGGNANGGGQANPFGGFTFPPTGGNDGNSGNTNTGTGNLNASALAAKVDPGIVDITSQLKYNGASAQGTGMVISPNGLVLTNNHVINEATSVSATEVKSGRSYRVRVLGYDSKDDVALLQLVGASGLKTVSLGDSSKVKVGDAVLALGNAGGRGGLPSTAQGTVQALGQSIEASDSGAGTTEKLHGMIETDAPIQQGDSGGPLVNAKGQVIGMDTAANSSSYGSQQTATTGFAIPVNSAMKIADQIRAGHASTTVHIGLAGFMGVSVADASSPAGCAVGNEPGNGGFQPAVGSGALICYVAPGTPAQQAGLVAGDVITAIDGHAVTSADALTKLMAGDHPGDHVSVGYVARDGSRQSATVILAEWAK